MTIYGDRKVEILVMVAKRTLLFSLEDSAVADASRNGDNVLLHPRLFDKGALA